jgi:hypothetical protein
VTPPDQHRSRSRNRFPTDHKPAWNGRTGRSGADRGKVGGNAMAKYARYLELAQQARVLGDEIAVLCISRHQIRADDGIASSILAAFG